MKGIHGNLNLKNCGVFGAYDSESVTHLNMLLTFFRAVKNLNTIFTVTE